MDMVTATEHGSLNALILRVPRDWMILHGLNICHPKR